MAPQGLVARKVHPQREQHRKERGDSEQDSETPLLPSEEDEPCKREGRRQPSEIDELLAARRVPAIDEVHGLRGIATQLVHRPPAPLRRARDQRVADRDADPDADGVGAIEIDGATVRPPLRGVHNLRNAMLALAAARECGVSATDAARGWGRLGTEDRRKLDLHRDLFGRAPLGNLDLTPWPMGIEEDEEIDGAVAAVLVVVALRSTRR